VADLLFKISVIIFEDCYLLVLTVIDFKLGRDEFLYFCKVFFDSILNKVERDKILASE
jgi:hypothetical protein